MKKQMKTPPVQDEPTSPAQDKPTSSAQELPTSPIHESAEKVPQTPITSPEALENPSPVQDQFPYIPHTPIASPVRTENVVIDDSLSQFMNDKDFENLVYSSLDLETGNANNEPPTETETTVENVENDIDENITKPDVGLNENSDTETDIDDCEDTCPKCVYLHD